MTSRMKLTNRVKRFGNFLRTQRSSQKTSGAIRKLQGVQTTGKKKRVLRSKVCKSGCNSKVPDKVPHEDFGELQSNASTKNPYKISVHPEISTKNHHREDMIYLENSHDLKNLRVVDQGSDAIKEKNESLTSNYYDDSWFEDLPEMEIEDKHLERSHDKGNQELRKEMNDTMKGFAFKDTSQKLRKNKMRNTAIFGDFSKSDSYSSELKSLTSDNEQEAIDTADIRAQLHLEEAARGDKNLILIPTLADSCLLQKRLKSSIYNLKYSSEWAKPTLEMFDFKP